MGAKLENQAKLLRLQRRIHRALEEEARRLLGAQPAAIRRYRREFDRDFARSRGAVTTDRLLERVRAADVTFVADFHTFSQAQRTALRIAREAARSGENWAIALEAVESRHQRSLDAYANGRLSLEALRARLRFDESWGFPWENYSPLLEWARKGGHQLVALDRPRELPLRARARDLDERDRWAAGLITDLHARSRSLRVIALYGELHVARAHLPSALERVSRQFLGRALRSLTIHQNHDGLYWRLARAGHAHETQAVRLARDSYCVFSSTPWAKLQSLVSWAEGVHEDGDFDEPDVLSLLRTYGGTLAELFGLPEPRWDSLSVRTIQDADFVEKLAGPASERALARFHVLRNLPLYLPRQRIAYVGSASQNGVAEMAAVHLLRDHKRAGPLFEPTREGIHARALESAFGFFGSLALNPRRKCDLAADHRARIRALEQGREREAFAGERLARALTLELLSDRPGVALERAARNPAAAAFGARGFGAALARRLHAAVLAGKARVEDVRAVCFTARMTSEARIRGLGELAERGDLPRSKREQL